MRFSAVPCFLMFASLVAWASTAQAQATPAKAGAIRPAAVALGRPVDFDKDIVPIIETKCLACHNVAILESRLNVEDVPSLLKGGKRGPAIVPKDPDKSLLYQVAARATDPVMPPLPNKVEAKAVTPEELGLLRQWIIEGAQGSTNTGGTKVSFSSLPATVHPIYSVALSEWGRFAACGRANQLDLYDLALGEQVARLTDPALAGLQSNGKLLYPQGAAHQDFIHAVAFSPNGDLLATAGYREVKLWQRPANVVLQQFAAPQSIAALAISPDGKWAALATPENTVQLWDLSQNKAGPVCQGHAAAVTGAVFSADNSQLLTAAKDKTLRAWSVSEGKQTAQLETPQEILSVALTVEGNRICSGHADNIIRLWNVPFDQPKPAEGDKPAEPVKALLEIKGHSGPVTALAVMAGVPNQLVSGSQDGSLRYWDLGNGNQVRTVNHGAGISAVSVRSDGTFAVTAGNQIAKLWNMTNNQQVAEFRGNLEYQRRITRLTEAEAVAKSRVAVADGLFKSAEKSFKEREEGTKKAGESVKTTEKTLTDAAAKEKTAQEALTAAKTELAAKPDDAGLQKKKTDAEMAASKEADALKKANDAHESAKKSVVQADKSQATADELQKQAKANHEAEVAVQKQAETALQQARGEQGNLEKPFKAAAISLDGRFVATAGDGQQVQLWDGKTGQPLEMFSSQQSPIQTLAFTAQGKLVSAAENKQVAIFDPQPAWKLVGILGPNAKSPQDVSTSPLISRVLSLAFSPDGKLLATGGGDPSRSGEVMLWDVEQRAFQKLIPDAHSDTVFALEFSRDGKQLVSGAADKFVKVHDVTSGKLVRSLEGHTNHVLGVAWKGDQSVIASSGADNAIKVWNVESGEQQRTINNYTKQVTAVHFVGATENLISCSGDKSIKLHRSTDGGNYRSFGGSNDFFYAVAVSRDENVVVAGGEDGVLRVWNGKSGQSLFNFEPPKVPANNQQAAAK